MLVWVTDAVPSCSHLDPWVARSGPLLVQVYPLGTIFQTRVNKNNKVNVIQSHSVKQNKPQLSVWIGDIFYAFFYLQHGQPYHIVNRENFHLPHSKRTLDAWFKGKNMSFMTPSQNLKNQKHNVLYRWNKRKAKHDETEKQKCIPGAFSHISQRGTSMGSARPTLTCRLASLLHKWTCIPIYIYIFKEGSLNLASGRKWVINEYHGDKL